MTNFITNWKFYNFVHFFSDVDVWQETEKFRAERKLVIFDVSSCLNVIDIASRTEGESEKKINRFLHNLWAHTRRESTAGSKATISNGGSGKDWISIFPSKLRNLIAPSWCTSAQRQFKRKKYCNFMRLSLLRRLPSNESSIVHISHSWRLVTLLICSHIYHISSPARSKFIPRLGSLKISMRVVINI